MSLNGINMTSLMQEQNMHANIQVYCSQSCSPVGTPLLWGGALSFIALGMLIGLGMTTDLE